MRTSGPVLPYNRVLQRCIQALHLTFASFRFLPVLLVLFVLAACQSSSVTDVLELDESKVSGPAVASETIGEGETLVSLILHRSGLQPLADLSTSYRNGSVLAAQDFGGDQIKLTIDDARGHGPSVAPFVRTAMAQKAQLLIVPGDVDSVREAVSVTSGKSIPIIALRSEKTNAGNRVYAVLQNGLDSLIAGINYAWGTRQKIIVLVPSGEQANHIAESIRKAVPATVQIIIHDQSQEPKSAVKENAAILKAADTIAFAGTDQSLIKLATEIRGIEKRGAPKIFIGRQDLPISIRNSPPFEGALIATLDTSSLKLIDERYQKAFGQPMPLEAAHAYDIIATAAGLVRVKGKDGISKANLEIQSGFRGATGLFRFRADGSVERLHGISKVKKGKLVTVQKVPKVF